MMEQVYRHIHLHFYRLKLEQLSIQLGYTECHLEYCCSACITWIRDQIPVNRQSLKCLKNKNNFMNKAASQESCQEIADRVGFRMRGRDFSLPLKCEYLTEAEFQQTSVRHQRQLQNSLHITSNN